MLTAGTIISRAALIAKAPNYTSPTSTFGNIALDLLNAVLSDLCLEYDFAAARKVFNFTFNPGLQSDFGSGPYILPVDYLRASGSSGEGQKTFFWTLLGVPYPMVPCDLSEFDMQVQQAGLQSYPWLWATDMANASLSSLSRYRWATSIATTVNSVNATLTLPATGLVPAVGDGVGGVGVTPGTTLLTFNGTTGAVTLSQPAPATVSPAGDATVFGGTGAQAFAYPPPSGAYPVTIRYQSLMPPVINMTAYCWFPEDGYLIEELAGRMMQITDDQRTIEFLGDGQRPGRAGRLLQRFLGNMDDKRNRPQQVELDRRRFGPSMRTLRNTKQVGW